MKINKLLFIFIITVLCTHTLFAQNNINYQIANSLLQKQNYEEALPLFEELVNEQPDVQIFFDQYTECLIQLKQYEKAITASHKRIDKNINTSQTRILLGKLYHLNGDTTKAFNTWQQNIKEQPGNLQVYKNTARAMTERREFSKAVDIYLEARKRLNNEQIFFGDIANAYMQAADYGKAIGEYLNLLMTSPQQIGLIQRNLLRYKDPILYDVAIIEINEKLNSLSTQHPSYQNLHLLHIWLLQENKLYRRAVSAAREYEEKTSDLTYSLFNLGRRLVENNEFELAREAFSYYIENGTKEISWRSMEELANTNIRWAEYLDDFGLSSPVTKDSLYQAAFNLLSSLESQTETYPRLDNVYITQAEISLDYLHDKRQALSYVEKLKDIAPNSREAEINYIEGRIFLYDKKYSNARISLTRANKIARVGELAEKTRYFLALTDFYAVDYEFSLIQLKTLGRRNNTSFYANDALKLRLWIQKGLAADSTGAKLDEFSKAVAARDFGNKEKAKTLLASIAKDMQHPFSDDAAIIQSSQLIEPNNVDEVLSVLSLLSLHNTTPVRERLFWERAKFLDTFLSKNNVPNEILQENNLTVSRLLEYYEKLIIEYPQGFYAPFARERISELSNQTS